MSAPRYYLDIPFQFARCVVPAALYDILVPRLCQTGRFVWRPDPSIPVELPLEQASPVVWDGGDPWHFRLHFQTETESRRWRISGRLDRGDQSLPLADAVMLLPKGFVLSPHCLARLDALGDVSAARARP